ncbi:PAN domain protein, partial [Oesophagostomum dentatum]
RCILSSEPRKEELTSRPETTFYEKICVSDAVSSQCSGAAVERRPNLVIVGFLRDTASTRTPEECIEKCVTAERELGFQCLSAMYYYDLISDQETVLNCILNDASAKTNPESTAEEDRSIVDYFGVDDCYGLPEIADTRQKHLKSFPLTVEDDVIGGARTPGSQVKVLRRTRSSSFQQRR